MYIKNQLIYYVYLNSEITSIVSTIYEMTQGPDDVTEIEICDVIDRLNEIADPSSLQKVRQQH